MLSSWGQSLLVSAVVGIYLVDIYLTEQRMASVVAYSWWLPSQHLYTLLSESQPCFQLLSTWKKATHALSAYNRRTVFSPHRPQAEPCSVSSAWQSQMHASRVFLILTVPSLPRSKKATCLQVLSSLSPSDTSPVIHLSLFRSWPVFPLDFRQSSDDWARLGVLMAYHAKALLGELVNLGDTLFTSPFRLVAASTVSGLPCWGNHDAAGGRVTF